MRRRLAEDGYELTPDELVDRVVSIGLKAAAHMDTTPLRAFEMLNRYSMNPGPPPWEGTFDDVGEAREFAARAAHHQRVKTVVVPVGEKCWQVVVS